jgi:hypothetical protein
MSLPTRRIALHYYSAGGIFAQQFLVGSLRSQYRDKDSDRGNETEGIHRVDSTARPLRLPHPTNTRGVLRRAKPATETPSETRVVFPLPSPAAQCSPSAPIDFEFIERLL